MFYLYNIKKILITTALCGLAGCTVGPDFKKPEPPPVDTYTETPLPEKTIDSPIKGGEAQHFHIDSPIEAQWWELYHSEELNALIKRGIENSPDLKTAEATYRQAQEELRALTGELYFPVVGLEAFGGREQLSAFDSLEGSPGETLADFPIQQLSLYNVDVNVSYVLDVFGGNRRAIESLRAEVDVERYELDATYIALTANIVTSAVAEAALRAEISATNEIIAKAESFLEVMQKQYKVGSISNIEILNQQTVLAQARASLPPLENELAQTRHALSVLVGGFPGDGKLPEFHLDSLHLPTDLPVSLPSTLIQQRPDIRVAEALLHQATADIGVATANLLPTFPIEAAYGVNSDTLNNFFNANDIFWNWQAGVLQTVFNGGALRAQKRAAIAAFEAASAQYNLAVLTGLQNVADTLSALESDARTLHETVTAENAAKEMMELAKKQYAGGSLSYLELLAVETAYQETYIERIDAQAARYADTAALFQALGGLWWTDDEDEDENQDDDDKNK